MVCLLFPVSVIDNVIVKNLLKARFCLVPVWTCKWIVECLLFYRSVRSWLRSLLPLVPPTFPYPSLSPCLYSLFPWPQSPPPSTPQAWLYAPCITVRYLPSPLSCPVMVTSSRSTENTGETVSLYSVLVPSVTGVLAAEKTHCRESLAQPLQTYTKYTQCRWILQRLS